MGRQRCAIDPRWNVLEDDFLCVGEALAVGEFLAIVHDVHAEADFMGEPGEVQAHMARADDVELRRRFDRLDVHVHRPAADETGFLGEVVGQLVVDELRPAAGDRFACLPEGVVFVAPAADGADDSAVGEHEHFRADTLRRRAHGGDDGDEGRRLPTLERVGNGREHFLVHLR